MTREHFFLVLNSALVLTSCVGTSAAGTGLELTLAAANRHLVIGEPIDITLTLRNTSKEGIVIDDTFEIDYSDVLKVTITKICPTGKPVGRHFHRSLRGREWEKVTRTIKPGESIVKQYVLLYDTRRLEFIFPEESQYKVVVTFHFNTDDYSQKVASNEIKVDVKGTGDEKREALELWRNKGIGFAVQGTHVSEEAIQDMKALVARFPSSIYSKYARRVLARISAN